MDAPLGTALNEYQLQLKSMRSTDLLGRDVLVRDVANSLAAGRSVLLYRPDGIGKSAVIAALAQDGIVIIDPFEHITRQHAYRMRRALDHGAVHLVATRDIRRRALGAVGRILWRFSMVRVRELPDAIINRVVMREIQRSSLEADLERSWMREVVILARGRPGFAAAMGRFAVEWRSAHGYWPIPGFAFAATRGEAVIGSRQAPGHRWHGVS
jgi:hypothetical protein